MNNWVEIQHLKSGTTVVALIAKVVRPDGLSYTTDPWTGWKRDDGTFARWPHAFPPTHYYVIPQLDTE